VSPLFKRNGGAKAADAAAPGNGGVMPIASVTWRQRAKVHGRVRAVRVQPLAGVPTLECTVYDETGGMAVVFLGRREIPGIRPGTTLTAEGMVSDHQGRLAILNPAYQLLGPGEH
jgi:RecJ-like exonuclease